jgi:hypothetical protein
MHARDRRAPSDCRAATGVPTMRLSGERAVSPAEAMSDPVFAFNMDRATFPEIGVRID